jgi:hypothetical protein
MGTDIALKSRIFLRHLQDAVRNGDKSQIARMTQYPLKVFSGNDTILVRDRKQLISTYNDVFVESVRRRILDDKASRCLFANAQGFMIGNGELWFTQFGNDDFKIISINTTEYPDSPKQKGSGGIDSGLKFPHSSWTCTDSVCQLIDPCQRHETRGR